MSDIVQRLRNIGADLGQGIAGYRDKDTKRSAEGLAGAAIVALDAADYIETLERALRIASVPLSGLDEHVERFPGA
tara:strand:- start:64 stop:291 length:228 start_codon:yes stop_codon:yes gene_type:complete